MEADEVAMRLTSTKMGFPVAPALSEGDIARLMNMRGEPAQFPPEFEFSPANGAPLAPGKASAAVWIAPNGARAVAAAVISEAAGLKQTYRNIPGERLREHDADSLADCEMVLPPPGTYEFFSGTFGTVSAALLALDISKGMLFGWLPASGQWQPLQGIDGRLLSESNLPHRAWRAEMAVGFNSKLFLPTEHGLARVVPDLPSLQCQIDYVGNAPVVGAPIAFDNRVWAPIQHPDGVVQFVSVDAAGQAGPPLTIPGGLTLGEVSAPCAYSRIAIWPCTGGQLRLQKMTDGSVAASFSEWDTGVVPQFEFGSVHLSRSGALWQLCFDSRIDSYIYTRLGVQQTEQVSALAPRLCSGTINYRFASKQKADPWLEPEHGDDGLANTAVWPLLELGQRAGVLALKMDCNAALANLLHSSDRVRAQLMYDDDDSVITFHTLAVSKPWELRVFLHDDHLWAYHPSLQRMLGWDVQA